jgi:hypothetical protein
MTIRRLALACLLVATVVAGAGLALYLALPAKGGANEIELQGIDENDLAGWGRLLRPDGRPPKVSPEAAFATASRGKPNRPGAEEPEALEIVLVRLVNESREPPLDALAWAVNFDPATVEADPPIGPVGAQLPPWCGGVHPEYDVVFVDAQTGELIFEIQYNATLPDDDPSATCPPGDYPSPTAVPGQPTAVPFSTGATSR